MNTWENLVTIGRSRGSGPLRCGEKETRMRMRMSGKAEVKLDIKMFQVPT